MFSGENTNIVSVLSAELAQGVLRVKHITVKLTFVGVGVGLGGIYSLAIHTAVYEET